MRTESKQLTRLLPGHQRVGRADSFGGPNKRAHCLIVVTAARGLNIETGVDQAITECARAKVDAHARII